MVNAEGYRDDTADIAIARADRELARRRKWVRNHERRRSTKVLQIPPVEDEKSRGPKAGPIRVPKV